MEANSLPRSYRLPATPTSEWPKGLQPAGVWWRWRAETGAIRTTERLVRSGLIYIGLARVMARTRGRGGKKRKGWMIKRWRMSVRRRGERNERAWWMGRLWMTGESEMRKRWRKKGRKEGWCKRTEGNIGGKMTRWCGTIGTRRKSDDEKGDRREMKEERVMREAGKERWEREREIKRGEGNRRESWTNHREGRRELKEKTEELIKETDRGKEEKGRVDKEWHKTERERRKREEEEDKLRKKQTRWWKKQKSRTVR